MPELIDKGKLLYYLEAIKPDEYVSAYGEAAIDVINHIENYVSEMPTAEQPTIEPEVRRGEWVEETEPDENGNVISMCNQCYHTDEHCKNIKIPYCWYCGARMDGGADNG